MRCLRWIALLSVGLVLPVAFAQGSHAYTSTVDRFRILAPGEYAIVEIDYPSEYGVVFPVRVHRLAAGANRYSVTAVDYTNARTIHAARPNELIADSRERPEAAR
jgi:hypothetical protein